MLKKRMPTIGILALAVGATLGSDAVYAATASATASITGIAATGLTWLDWEPMVVGSAETPFDYGEISSTELNYHFSTITPSGSSLATIDHSGVALPETTAAASTHGSGRAVVGWTLYYATDVTGIATVDVEYLYNATVANLGLGETALASSYVSVTVGGAGDRSPVSDEAHFYFDNIESDISGVGTLRINFLATAGEFGNSIDFVVASNAQALPPVPVPAAIWLLGSALAGLAGFARCKV